MYMSSTIFLSLRQRVLIDHHGGSDRLFCSESTETPTSAVSEKLRCDDESALDWLEKMLVFDPRKRINAAECLSHEYVSPYHDLTDEPVAAEKFDWSFNDADLPIDNWKVMMYVEILGACPRLVGLGCYEPMQLV
jgi:serine/threonine protein kinase